MTHLMLGEAMLNTICNIILYYSKYILYNKNCRKLLYRRSHFNVVPEGFEETRSKSSKEHLVIALVLLNAIRDRATFHKISGEPSVVCFEQVASLAFLDTKYEERESGS